MTKKILAGISGIIFTFLLLEFTLRLFSSGYMAVRKSQHSSAANREKLVICVGDSFTFGTGASKGGAYPDQLAALSRYNVEIVNKGVPGNNSTESLSAIKELAAGARPDTIILLTGRNNFWNFNGYSSFAGKTGTARLLEKLHSLKTYRLAVLMHQKMQEEHALARIRRQAVAAAKEAAPKPPQPDPDRKRNREEILNDKATLYLSSNKQYEAESAFKEVLRINSNNINALTGLATLYRDQGRKTELPGIANRLVQAKSIRPEPYRIASVIYETAGDYDAMRAANMALLSIFPNDIDAIFRVGYSYSMTNRQEKAYLWYRDHRQYLSAPALQYPFFNTAHSMGIYYWNEAEQEKTKTSRNGKTLQNAETKISAKAYDFYRKSITAYQDALETNPTAYEAYQGLIISYSSIGEPEKALQAIKTGIRTIPYRKEDFHKLLANVIHMSPQTPELFSLAENILSGKLKSEQLTPSGRQIEAWLYADIEASLKFCRENNIRLVLVNYPPQPSSLRTLRPEYDLIKAVTDRVAADSGVPYVDIYSRFTSMAQTEQDIDKYFVADGHCNDAGYKVMAEEIYRTLNSNIQHSAQ